MKLGVLKTEIYEKHDSAIAYIRLLIDLNCYEELYQEAINLSNFYPDIKRNLGTFAAYIGDVSEVLKYVPATLDPESTFEEWTALILYHSINGTLDEIVYTHPLPEHRTTRAYLYFVNFDFHKVYHLLTEAKECINPTDLWMLWFACRKLDKQEEATQNLERICKIRAPQFIHLHEKILLEELLRCVNDENIDRIQNYLIHLLNERPTSLNILSCLSNIQTDPIKSQYRERVKKTCAAFPNLRNKVRLILIGNNSEEKKIEILCAFFKSVPPNYYLFCTIANLYLRNKKYKAYEELVNDAIARSNNRLDFVIHKVTRISQVQGEEYFLQNLKENLLLIESTLLRTPFNRQLINMKAKVLYLLRRYDEALVVIDQFNKLSPNCPFFTEFMAKCCEQYRNVDQVEKALEESYRLYQMSSTLAALKELYKRYKTDLEYISFIITRILPTKKLHSGEFEEIHTLLDQLEDREEGHKLIDQVVRTPHNAIFVAKRGCYYSDYEHEKAMVDVDFIIAQVPHDTSSKKLKVRLLVDMDRGDEAVAFLFAHNLEVSSELLELMIVDRITEEQYDVVIRLYKRAKTPLSYEAKKYVVQSYIEEREYHVGLRLLKELYNEDPKDLIVLQQKALCFQNLGQFGSALDVTKEGLESHPDNQVLLDIKRECEEESRDTTKHVNPKPQQEKKQKPTPDPKRVPHIIEPQKKKTTIHDLKNSAQASRDESVHIESIKKAPIHLQNSPAHAVNPLHQGYSLEQIKEIARKGEKDTGISKPKPAAAESAPVIRSDPPKAIVKVHLRIHEKVFLTKGLTVLKQTFEMNSALLEPKIAFNNYLYAILRVFTPLRLNSTHPALIKDLTAIRDSARHHSDQVSLEKLKSMFTYLKSKDLDTQLQDWIKEKGLITRLMLQNQMITERYPKKTAIQKITEELEFISIQTGEKATWKDRLYHRNAIKASLSIIGEASNFVMGEQKALLSEYREEGNKIAHQFFEDGDTVEFIERCQEEEIGPEALWDLANKAPVILKTLKVYL